MEYGVHSMVFVLVYGVGPCIYYPANKFTGIEALTMFLQRLIRVVNQALEAITSQHKT